MGVPTGVGRRRDRIPVQPCCRCGIRRARQATPCYFRSVRNVALPVWWPVMRPIAPAERSRAAAAPRRLVATTGLIVRTDSLRKQHMGTEMEGPGNRGKSTAVEQTPFVNDIYRSQTGHLPWLARMFPGFTLYRKLIRIVLAASSKAKQGRYDDDEWLRSSWNILRALESVGARVEVSGLNHLREAQCPCVVIGNHMSILETMILPGIVRSFWPVTFIVKQNLLEYPAFGHVMRSRDPIAVGRANPRQDLKAVLEGGKERLAKGTSIIVFPQSTRSARFDPAIFNTIGVKLAQRTGVPVIPLALKTDAWRNGRWLKDFGRIDPAKTIHFAFAEARAVQPRGNQDHETIVAFIKGKLREWEEPADVRS